MDGRDVQGYKPRNRRPTTCFSQWVVEAPETPAVRVSDPQRKWRMISGSAESGAGAARSTPPLKMAEGVRQVEPGLSLAPV